jgi:hypothetical protein
MVILPRIHLKSAPRRIAQCIDAAGNCYNVSEGKFKVAGMFHFMNNPVALPFELGADLLLLVPKLQLGNTAVQKLQLR